jgi:dUTP pyrophosphatase
VDARRTFTRAAARRDRVADVVSVAVDELEVRLLKPDARAPARTRPGDAGFDLSAAEEFVLAPGERRVVCTGVAIALPPNVAGLVVPRSGLAARHGISVVNGPGLVDPNYRGELRVILVNLGQERFVGHVGDRIAQLLLVPFVAPAVRVVEELSPAPDERGENGFGSSGR